MSAVGRTVALCVAFIVAVVGLYVYSIVRTPQLSVDELREQGVFLMPRPRDIAPFELQDHTGEMEVAEAQARLLEAAAQIRALEQLRKKGRR